MTAIGRAGVVRVGRAVAARTRTAEVTFLAAAVAYYAFLSLLPALLLLLAVASTLGGDALGDALVASAGDLLTPAGEGVVRAAVASAAGRGGATVLGAGVLLWSVLKVFRGLDIAFRKVYGTAEISSLVDQVRDGLTAVVGVGGALAVMVGVGAAMAVAEIGGAAETFGVALLPAVLTGVFLPLYYVFPDVDVTAREALPGTVVAAVGWTLLQAGFQVYAAGAAQYRTYGVLGGVVLLVTWFYVAAVVLLVGAVVNAVLAGRRSPSNTGTGTDPTERGAPAGDRQLQQPRGRRPTRMSERNRTDGPDGSDTAPERGGTDGDDTDPAGAPDVAELQREVRRLERELAAFEEEIEERTVDRPRLKADLQQYVRRRLRRGHARGWGPYLVLLYGTALTLGGFYWLDGIYAIGAMLVAGLSTLGLYVLFVLFGVGLNLLGTPGKVLDALRNRRR